jgi:tRNA(adenine34) deaminase
MEPEQAKQFMRAALQQATLALEQGELPIGAVIVLDGRIIAAAHTAEIAEQRLLVHAELRALEDADRLRPFPGKRSAAHLFTTLEPCLMCLGAAMSFHIGAISYALESPADGAVQLAQGWQRDEAAMPSYRPPAIHGGVLRQESIDLFKAYVARHSSGGLWEWAKTVAAL